MTLRGGSRAIGASSAIAELSEVRVAVEPLAPTAAVTRDWLRAKTISTRFSERLTKARESLSDSAALTKLKPDLERIAVTESAEAFNGGKAEVADALPQATTSLLKVWDSTLDKLTCPVCFAADGTIVGIKEKFPYGTPGAVHPWCRCTWQVLQFSERGSEGLIEPKEPAKVISLPVAKPSPIAVPAQPITLSKNPQLDHLLRDGFSGAIPQSGLRPESFAHLRAGGAVHGGIPTLKIRADGGVQIVDGRHRITLARERGDEVLAARVLVEGRRGGIKLDTEAEVPLRPAGIGEQKVIAVKRAKRHR